RRRLFFEHGYELGADPFALDLWVRHAAEAIEKPLGRVHLHEMNLERVAKRSRNALRLTLAEEAIVHEETGELVAHGAVHQHSDHGRVDTSGERAQHASCAHLAADGLHGRVDERRHGPLSARAAETDEVIEYGLALGRVGHFWMKLNGVE